MVWMRYTHVEQTSLLKIPLNIALLVGSSVFSTVYSTSLWAIHAVGVGEEA